MTASASNQLISIQPDELKFVFELEKQSYCHLEIANQTEHYVAFKPWDSCIIKVTLLAMWKCPQDMRCKDIFLLQSAIVSPHTDGNELPENTFNKESRNTVEECKLKVSYIPPPSPQESFVSGVTNGDIHNSQTISKLKEERDAATKKTQQLQRELDTRKRQRNERNDQGLITLKITTLVGLIGLMIGFILKLILSLPPQQAQLLNTLYDLNKK